jgi:sugar phosphate isomerase/epimerase
VETREKRAPAHLQRVKDCLRRIVEHAASKNVRIALESRRGYEEIPSERELAALLNELNSEQVGYWHDFGHSQIKENLGFIDHGEWLGAVASRAFGSHVQDCVWPAKDHEAPFTGGIDFDKLVPLLPTNCLFVWEMSPNKTADAIRQSVRIWKERFGE